MHQEDATISESLVNTVNSSTAMILATPFVKVRQMKVLLRQLSENRSEIQLPTKSRLEVRDRRHDGARLSLPPRQPSACLAEFPRSRSLTHTRALTVRTDMSGQDARRVSKEDILAGQSPGLFWTMEEPTGLTVEERSRRASSEEMFKEQILKGVSPGIFWSMPPKGGEEHLDSSLAENSTEKTSVRTLSGVIPESVQKASKWARIKEDVLAGKSPGLFWSD